MCKEEVDSFKFHREFSPFSAQISVPLEDIKNLELFAKWFQLVPVSPTTRGEMGSLRIRARYLHEIIMPEDKYSTLKEVKTTCYKYELVVKICTAFTFPDKNKISRSNLY